MKTTLLLIAIMLLGTTAIGQSKEANKVLDRKSFFEQNNKFSKPITISPQLLNKQKTEKRQMNLADLNLFYSPEKNSIPVWSPDSNYVYNMPGTHAFDRSKYKVSATFVGVKIEDKAAKTEK